MMESLPRLGDMGLEYSGLHRVFLTYREDVVLFLGAITCASISK